MEISFQSFSKHCNKRKPTWMSKLFAVIAIQSVSNFIGILCNYKTWVFVHVQCSFSFFLANESYQIHSLRQCYPQGSQGMLSCKNFIQHFPCRFTFNVSIMIFQLFMWFNKLSIKYDVNWSILQVFFLTYKNVLNGGLCGNIPYCLFIYLLSAKQRFAG